VGRRFHPAAGQPRLADIAILPQSLGLIQELSVRENVELPARLASDGEIVRSASTAC
jgi:ABC-type lipoprotein export system ATPase subunit